jgi:hypothetical protein
VSALLASATHVRHRKLVCLSHINMQGVQRNRVRHMIKRLQRCSQELLQIIVPCSRQMTLSSSSIAHVALIWTLSSKRSETAKVTDLVFAEELLISCGSNQARLSRKLKEQHKLCASLILHWCACCWPLLSLELIPPVVMASVIQTAKLAALPAVVISAAPRE